MRQLAAKLLRNFLGLDGFIWAIGVVEDREDPLKLGRCKVRYFGWHTEDKTLIPTEDLPWSLPLTDLDSGRSVVGPKEGDWIIGFFRDSITAQQPTMIGILPGFQEKEANPEIGFNDPRPDGVLNSSTVPRDPLSKPIQFDDGTGNELVELGKVSRYPQNESDGKLRYVDGKEPITNRYERGELVPLTVVESKIDNIKIGQEEVETGTHPDSAVGTDKESPNLPWTEKETEYSAKYPYNHAYWSESGHLIEIDDTPEKQRLHWYHRSGTFREIHPKGEQVEKIVMNEYHICLKDRFTHIEASDNETVDWNKKVIINKDRKNYDYDQLVGANGNWNKTVEKGNYNKYLMDGDENTRIVGNRFYRIEEDEVGHVLIDKCITIDADYVVHVHGKANLVVHDDVIIRTYKDAIVTIDGNADVEIHKDAKVKVHGDLYEEVLGDKIEIIAGDYKQIVEGNKIVQVMGNKLDHVKGSQVRMTDGNLSDMAAGYYDIISPELELNHEIPGMADPIPPASPDAVDDLVIDERELKVAKLIKEKLPESE